MSVAPSAAREAVIAMVAIVITRGEAIAAPIVAIDTAAIAPSFPVAQALVAALRALLPRLLSLGPTLLAQLFAPAIAILGFLSALVPLTRSQLIALASLLRPQFVTSGAVEALVAQLLALTRLELPQFAAIAIALLRTLAAIADSLAARSVAKRALDPLAAISSGLAAALTAAGILELAAAAAAAEFWTAATTAKFAAAATAPKFVTATAATAKALAATATTPAEALAATATTPAEALSTTATAPADTFTAAATAKTFAAATAALAISRGKIGSDTDTTGRKAGFWPCGRQGGRTQQHHSGKQASDTNHQSEFQAGTVAPLVQVRPPLGCSLPTREVCLFARHNRAAAHVINLKPCFPSLKRRCKVPHTGFARNSDEKVAINLDQGG